MTEIFTASGILLLIGIILRWHHHMIGECVTRRDCEMCKEGTANELGHGGERFTRIDTTLEQFRKTQEVQAKDLSSVKELLGRIEERVNYLAQTNGYKDKQ